MAIFRPPLITRIIRGKRPRDFLIANSLPLLGAAPAITGTFASTLAAITAEFTGAEEFTGTFASTLPAITAAFVGEGSTPFVLGDIQDTRRRKRRPAETDPLGLLSTTLAPATPITGTFAAILAPITAAFVGAETFEGTFASTLPSVTAAFAGEETFTGFFDSTLAAITAAFEGLTEGEAPAPVFAPDVYVKLAKRRRKKRKDLEELHAELRIALGLDPLPLQVAVYPEPPEALPEPAKPFLVNLEGYGLRTQVERMLKALKAVEENRRCALEDDELAIEKLLELI